MADRDTHRFYALLSELDHRLGGPRELRHCAASNGWPLNGVYFFFLRPVRTGQLGMVHESCEWVLKP